MPLISNALIGAYEIRNDVIRKNILRIVNFLEGGELYSVTLRKIFSVYHDINIGMYSYGGCFSTENIAPGTVIGRYCSFARNVYVYTRNHPVNWKSTHPFFFNSNLGIVEQDMISRSKITIGNDVWIGMNVVILPSVSVVGDGAVIGAGSIVTKDIPPYAVVAGNPAKIIKYRFREDSTEKLLESYWWNRSIDELKRELDGFLAPLD